MKRYASLWLLAVCLTCGAVQLQAQEPEPRAEQKELPREVPSPEKAAQRITDQMQKELQLTDKQYKKVYKLNLKEQKKNLFDPVGRNASANGRYARYERRTSANADGRRWNDAWYGWWPSTDGRSGNASHG